MCAEHRAWLEERVGVHLAMMSRAGEVVRGTLVRCLDAEGGVTVVVLACAVDRGDC